jgi:hypothetical protein
MADSITKQITPDALKALLAGGGEFLPPERLLNDLSETQASVVPSGSPYSIAQIVAHMDWWQEYQIARVRGKTPSRPGHLDDTFVPPVAGTWKDLVSRFLANLVETGQVAEEYGAQPSLEQPDRDIAYGLAECPALHNAYHLGQIALLRQILGFWPPAGGDESW